MPLRGLGCLDGASAEHGPRGGQRRRPGRDTRRPARGTTRRAADRPVAARRSLQRQRPSRGRSCRRGSCAGDGAPPRRARRPAVGARWARGQPPVDRDAGARAARVPGRGELDPHGRSAPAVGLRSLDRCAGARRIGDDHRDARPTDADARARRPPPDRGAGVLVVLGLVVRRSRRERGAPAPVASSIAAAVISTRRAQLVLGDRERRHQHDDVAERAHDRAAPARGERDLVAHPRRRAGSRVSSIPVMKPRRRISATVGSGATCSSSSSPSSAIFGCRRSSVRSDSNTSSVASAAAQASGLPVYVWPWKNVLNSSCSPRNAVVDRLGGERRRERQVAAGDALGHAHEVGRDVLLLAGEHRAGAAEADRDLVADQQHAELVAQLAHRAQVARRGARASRPRPARAARRSTAATSLAVRLEQPRACRPRRPARPGGSSNSSAPEASRGRGRCRRPRPSRSCRRGRRRAGRRTRSAAAAPRCCQCW